jgi:hypothetical protein
MQVLSEVSDLLKQFKGFGQVYRPINEMVSKLEDKIYTARKPKAPR